ncbi:MULTISPECIES: hypothetical protein [Haemophilus]|uniref:hypothetical protein n=1 Tax=Haemophilus TaxID=724 RepID=UPI00066C0C5A|nr:MULTISPECIES: hypothetical protein [Haemophilus]MDU2224124.1 hypothetical protein [Haemophilus parainfluenzae]MDU5695989.1 hypothetical protein [Haemophilus parainfluenzae]MDU5724665.1 hypothetical protein [Haemophilus parainfluenzae]MDU5748754.1 hypothetical protein [Haemophilus parainfluenzae]MDU5778024.1 hypothetical protein [Haemophilus parainfluenzae]
MNIMNTINIITLLFSIFSTIIISYIMLKQVKARIALDKKLKEFLIEEIKNNKLDVDRIESTIRKNTLKIVIEKNVPNDEINKFGEAISLAVNNAIKRLENEERIVIYRSIQNSSKDNISQYQNKILLDSINDLKHA